MKEINLCNNEGQRHGYWIDNWADSTSKGYYINGNESGYWIHSENKIPFLKQYFIT